MQRTLLTPPRLAAAAALSLGGLLAGVAAPTPAQAGDCLSYSLYVYGNRQGPMVGDAQKYCAVPTPWYETYHIGKTHETDTTVLPPGVPTGGGAHVWVPAP